MARPVWSDKAPDAAAVAAHLEACAKAEGSLRTEAVDTRGADAAVLHQAALARARTQLAERHGEKDRVLAQEVRAVDDLVRAANLLIERLREWYALHAPEAVRLAGDAERLTSLVATHGDRAAVLAALDEAGMAEASLGTDLEEADLAVLRSFAAALQGIHESWRGIERRVEALMEEVAPNVAAAVGPVLGARLIAEAGSLTRLASASAGTVQLYGAETALFRHLKEGARPPKHGLLFQHPAIHQAAPWHRGPAARVLAAAASLGAKADAFTGADLRERLRADVEAGLARIKRERPKPRRGPPKGPQGRGPPGKGGKGRRGPSGKGGKGGRGPPGGRSGGKPDGGRPGGPGRRDGKGGRRGPGAFRGDGGPAPPPGGGR